MFVLESLFNKLYQKRDSGAGAFMREFCEFFIKNFFFTEHFRWLILQQALRMYIYMYTHA